MILRYAWYCDTYRYHFFFSQSSKSHIFECQLLLLLHLCTCFLHITSCSLSYLYILYSWYFKYSFKTLMSINTVALCSDTLRDNCNEPNSHKGINELFWFWSFTVVSSDSDGLKSQWMSLFLCTKVEFVFEHLFDDFVKQNICTWCHESIQSGYAKQCDITLYWVSSNHQLLWVKGYAISIDRWERAIQMSRKIERRVKIIRAKLQVALLPSEMSKRECLLGKQKCGLCSR